MIFQAVDSDLVRTWLEFLTSQPRSAALLSDKNNPLVKILQETMQRLLYYEYLSRSMEALIK
jgi:hypothetical protein